MPLPRGPDLPEVYTSLGLSNSGSTGTGSLRRQPSARSIALDPSYSLAHRFLGIVLSHMSRHDEASWALREHAISIRLMPLIMHFRRKLRLLLAIIPLQSSSRNRRSPSIQNSGLATYNSHRLRNEWATQI